MTVTFLLAPSPLVLVTLQCKSKSESCSASQPSALVSTAALVLPLKILRFI